MGDKVKNQNYITIQGWMINELNLKGNELLIYAIIYGFSQTSGQVFNGGLQYLADWTNSTKQGVSKNLKSLVSKGFLQKIDKIINGVKFCEYYATEFNGVYNKVDEGIQQSLIPPMQQSLTNNISLNNTNNTNNKKESKKESFDEIINKYTDEEAVKDLLKEWLKVRKAKRSAMTNYAIELNLRKLDSLAEESKLSVVNYLEEVISRGWAAFYKINNYSNTPTKQPIRKEIVPSWLNNEPTEAEVPTEEEVAALRERINRTLGS